MKKTKNIFWGILFLLAAAAMLLRGFGYLQDIGFFTILFSAACFGLLIEGLIKRRWGQLLFSAAFLAILIGKYLGGLPFSPWMLLAAALLATIGLNILFPNRRLHFIHGCSWNHSNTPAELSDDIIGADNGENLSCDISFSSTVKYIRSQELKSIHLESSFGGMSVYFDNAALKDGTASVSLDVSFGSIELFIPSSWKTILQTGNSFGSVEEDGFCSEYSDNTLYITGDVSFGSLIIHYI